MKNLDPSYLRYIYDSILSGEVSPENESSLPDGLVGLYEENFPEVMPAAKRQRLLTIFAQWALLRKEVTVEFMAEVTALPVDEIRELIGTYSSWFNSPETGKYMLFHERIRAYFLQKLPEGELKALNERLIVRLKKAIEAQLKDEFEFYALQFLSDHLLTEAFANVEKGKELLAFNKNESNWNRQIKFSNQFKWTENSIKNSISWTAKFQPEETVMGYLDLVELQYKEKNDAENIVALVANNEMEMALKRIDSFAGNDKEGLQRKFTLFMLCLMELTLLDSKDKPFRKSAIENLLKHLDEKIPANQFDLINWNDFFPSYLMFKMASVWAELGVDCMVVYKRTDDWDSEWITEKGPYSDLQFEVLQEAIHLIEKNENKSSALQYISSELAKQGMVEEAFRYAYLIDDDIDKDTVILNILLSLVDIGLNKEALKYVSEISDLSIENLAIELAKKHYGNQAIECLNNILSNSIMYRTLRRISIILFKQGREEEAIEYSRSINNKKEKSIALCKIASIYFKRGNLNKANLIIEESISVAYRIKSLYSKCLALIVIKIEISKYGNIIFLNKINESIFEIINTIEVGRNKCILLLRVLIESLKKDKLYETKNLIEDCIACACEIQDVSKKRILLKKISIILAKYGLYSLSIKTVLQITDYSFSGEIETKNTLKSIAVIFAKFELSIEILDLPWGNKWIFKSYFLRFYAKELARNNKIEQALICANYIKEPNLFYCIYKIYSNNLCLKLDNYDVYYLLVESILNPKTHRIDNNDNILNEIINKLISIEKLEKAVILCLHGMTDSYTKYTTLQKLHKKLFFKGKYNENTFIKNMIECSFGNKFNVLLDLCDIMLEKNNFERADSLFHEAFDSISEISHNDDRVQAEHIIINYFVKFEKIDVAFELASRFSNLIKSDALKVISYELAKKIKFVEAIACARQIDDESTKIIALKEISRELSKQGMLVESASLIQEAIIFAKGISHEWEKISVLGEISIEQVRSGKIEEAMDCARCINDFSNRNKVYVRISTELHANNLIVEARLVLKEALENTLNISSIPLRIKELLNLMEVSVKHGQKEEAMFLMNESIECVNLINDIWDKSLALKEISSFLIKIGRLDDVNIILNNVINFARAIDSECDRKIKLLNSIANDLSKIGMKKEQEELVLESYRIALANIDKIKSGEALKELPFTLLSLGYDFEAIHCLLLIDNKISKVSRLKVISSRLATKGNFYLAEQTCLEIPQIADRHDCWKEIAKSLKELHGWEKALVLLEEFKSDEARTFYLKGWAESITLEDMSEELIQKALPLLAGDRDSIEALLQLYAIHQLFFEASGKERIARFNKTLNLQWALDIKAQFPEDGVVERRYDNLEEWIGDIEDEDDRAQIELWANKVNKGKMTEEEFGEKVRAL